MITPLALAQRPHLQTIRSSGPPRPSAPVKGSKKAKKVDDLPPLPPKHSREVLLAVKALRFTGMSDVEISSKLFAAGHQAPAVRRYLA